MNTKTKVRSLHFPNWQPITTAPKDGTYSLYKDANGDMMVLNEPPGCRIGRWERLETEWFGKSVEFEPVAWASLEPTEVVTSAAAAKLIRELERLIADWRGIASDQERLAQQARYNDRKGDEQYHAAQRSTLLTCAMGLASAIRNSMN